VREGGRTCAAPLVWVICASRFRLGVVFGHRVIPANDVNEAMRDAEAQTSSRNTHHHNTSLHRSPEIREHEDIRQVLSLWLCRHHHFSTEVSMSGFVRTFILDSTMYDELHEKSAWTKLASRPSRTPRLRRHRIFHSSSVCFHNANNLA
jgi:hypothetical protein